MRGNRQRQCPNSGASRLSNREALPIATTATTTRSRRTPSSARRTQHPRATEYQAFDGHARSLTYLLDAWLMFTHNHRLSLCPRRFSVSLSLCFSPSLPRSLQFSLAKKNFNILNVSKTYFVTVFNNSKCKIMWSNGRFLSALSDPQEPAANDKREGEKDHEED